jgi:PadR family transcriptional regulator, regulatory protein PadR
MTEATYYVLAALLDERLHGYGIVKKAAALSGGTVTLTTGTLYGALDRLVRQGLALDDGQAEVDGRVRRYYRLTDAGRDAVLAEAERMRRAARAVTPSGSRRLAGDGAA